MIYIIDSSKDFYGHNHLYINSLKKNKEISLIALDLKLLPNKVNVLSFMLNRYFCFKKQINTVSIGIAHFLHADLYYPVPFFFPFSNKKRKVVFTMHYFPDSRLKKMLLKNYCKKADVIVVHSEYLFDQYIGLGIKNTVCIEYPSFYNYTLIPHKCLLKKELNIPEDKVVLSCLGGTRYEKGLDILINALNLLDDKLKDKIILNVVGPAFEFNKDWIINKLNPRINSRLILQGVSDNEFMENVILTDFMIIPYRKNFNGNSGPLTEAICNEIPSIVANHGNLGYLTRKYKFGITFDSEDVYSLKRAVATILTDKINFDFSYKKKLSVDNFNDSYNKIYKSLMR